MKVLVEANVLGERTSFEIINDIKGYTISKVCCRQLFVLIKENMN